MDDNSFWVEEFNDELPFSLKRKRNARIKKLEFVGWGSKPLVEFLESIGKETSRAYSQQELTAIVTEYVNSNSLFNPQKKKRVVCDEQLHSLFGKKSFLRYKISELLEVHLSENHDESEDEPSNSSEDDILIASKGRKATASQKKKTPVVSKSCFAAVIAENIKLVYLKKSVVQDLQKDHGSFEDKISGSFVRVKSDPNDYFQKNSHQLQQVEGVRKARTGDAAFEIHLQLSNLMKDIPVSSLSDDDFSEEECEELRERIKAGLLKRPTVFELELKAQALHKDITKHWIEREIALLQKRIDHANEKGWRRQLFEFLEKKQLLQTEKEQDRLLSTMPQVVAEELDPVIKTVDALEENDEEEEREIGYSPKSIISGATDKFGAGDIVIPSDAIFVNRDTFTQDGCDEHGDPIQEQTHTTFSVRSENSGATQVVSVEDDLTQNTQTDCFAQKTKADSVSQEKQAPETEVIELSDDDDPVIGDQKDQTQKTGVNPEDAIWCYLDPMGNTQGPFPLTLLKQWSDDLYFEPSFRVWRAGQTIEEAVLLCDVLRQFFPFQMNYYI